MIFGWDLTLHSVVMTSQMGLFECKLPWNINSGRVGTLPCLLHLNHVKCIGDTQ